MIQFTSQNVIVVGASNKPERYSYKAIQMLCDHNHQVVGTHPKLTEVLGVKVYPSISEAASELSSVDTITLYVGARLSGGLKEAILSVKPKRVIMNPGAENQELLEVLEAAGIEVVEGCTLVMLSTNQF